MAQHKMTARVADERFLELERLFDVPRELLFQFFEDPKLLAAWWGPDGWETTVYQLEFRPGGEWHYRMKCIDPIQLSYYGQESFGKAVYREIVKPEKVIYTDYFSDAEGTIDENLPASEIIMAFIDLDRKTRLVSRSEFESAEALQIVLDMGVIEGIEQTWNRLDKLVEAMK